MKERKATILIVDDTETNIDVLLELLSDAYDVTVALSGESALEIARDEVLDLILLDIMMPKMDGYEVCKILKADAKTKDVPVIFITAKTDEESIEKAYEAGGIDYITKPFKPKELFARINTQLRLVKLLKDFENSQKKLREFNEVLEQKIKEELQINQRQNERMIHQSRQAQMGEMISMIAHQWRQPLAAISAVAGNLEIKIDLELFDLDTKKGQIEQSVYFKERLEKIRGFVENLTTTIDDFKNFYRPDKESVKTNFEEITTKAMAIVESSLLNDNIEIIYNYDSFEEIEIYDREMMQVILNIFKNAQDNFGEKQIKNPRITIATDKKSLRISDNGGGISSATLEKIFDPYFSTKDEKNGTGLGLYMSKTIIEEHHRGKLNAINIDDGVCFIINLDNDEETK